MQLISQNGQLSCQTFFMKYNLYSLCFFQFFLVIFYQHPRTYIYLTIKVSFLENYLIIIIMKQKTIKTVRGRPTRHNAVESDNIAAFHVRTQNRALISSFILTYVYAILNEQEKGETQKSLIDQYVKLGSFEWLTNLPKVFYHDGQQFERELKQKIQADGNGSEETFEVLKQSEKLLDFLKSVACLQLKSVINQIRNVAINFVISMKFHCNPEQALNNLRRFYFEDCQSQAINRDFRYCRFNLQYISETHKEIIDRNLRNYWKGFILILTKIIFIAATQSLPQSHLMKLYTCNEDKTDLQIFKQAIEVEQILYLKWQYQNLMASRTYPFLQTADLKQKVDVATGQGLEEQQNLCKRDHKGQKLQQFSTGRISLIEDQGIDMAKQLQIDSDDSQQEVHYLEKIKKIRKL